MKFKREDFSEFTESEQTLLQESGYFDDSWENDETPPETEKEEVVVGGGENIPSISQRRKKTKEYDESKESIEDQNKIQTEEEAVIDKEIETSRIANDPDEGILGYLKKLSTKKYWESEATEAYDFWKEWYKVSASLPIGLAKGVEEIAQTYGAPDDLFNLPKPENIKQGLAQGVGQQLPTYLVTLKGLKYVEKYASFFKGKTTLQSAIAGAITDWHTLDPRDPTVVDLLFVFDVVSKDSTIGALLKDTLGQNDADSETYARAKQALLGALFGALIDGSIRGYKGGKEKYQAYKEKKENVGNEPIPLQPLKSADEAQPTVKPDEAQPSTDKPKDPVIDQAKKQIEKEVSEEQLKDTETIVNGFGQMIDDIQAHGTTQQKAVIQENTPGPKAAAKETADKAAGQGAQSDRVWNTMSDEKKQEIVDMVIRLSKKERLFDENNLPDLDKINSMNFNKLIETDDVKALLQGISESVDIGDIVKTKIGVDEFDTISGIKAIQKAAGEGLGEGAAQQILREQAGNVRDAIKFVAVGRVIGAATLRQADEAFKKFAATQRKSDYNRAVQLTRLTTEVLGAGGELSKAASDLLRAHKKLIDNAEHLSEYKSFLSAELGVDPVIAVKSAKRSLIKDQVDEIEGTTVTTQSKLTGRRKHTKKSLTKRVAAKVKSLEKQLQDLEAGVLPKQKRKKLTSEKIRELEGKIKAKRASLKSASKTIKDGKGLTKEQKAARKEFEYLSKKIKDAREGKWKTPKEKKAATVDIAKLRAELKRVRKKYKKIAPDSYKAAQNVAKLKDELNELILIRDPSKAPKKPPKGKPREKTQEELDLIEKIRRQKFRLNMLKGDKLSKADLIDMIKREDLEASVDILQNESFKQLKSRVNYLSKHFVARTRDAGLQIYINGLLSTAKTFIVNGFGNTAAIGFNVTERLYAGAKKGGVITSGEARELVKGYLEQISSWDDLYALFRKGMDVDGVGGVKSDIGRLYESSLTKENWGLSGNLGRAMDWFGNLVDIPKQLMLASDEVFKAVTYGAEKRALSYRKAVQESGDDVAQINARFKEIMGEFELHQDLVDLADISKAKHTFTNKLPSHITADNFGKPKVEQGVALWMKEGLQKDPTGILRIHLPFFQTPANLLAFQFERTPAIRKLHKTIQEELRGDYGEAAKELAEARVATSNMMMGTMAMYAYNGNLTGPPPTDPKLRANMEAAMGGRHWNSIYAMGKWRKYNRLDPVGGMLETAAIAAITMKRSVRLYKQASEDRSNEIFDKGVEILTSGVTGLSNMIRDRHYFKSLSDLFSIWSGGSERKVNATLEKTIGGYNPFANFYSSARRNLIVKGAHPIKEIRPTKTEFLSVADTGKIVNEMAFDTWNKITPGAGSNQPDLTTGGEYKTHLGVDYQTDMGVLAKASNLVSSYFNVMPGATPSKSPLDQKIAELEMTTKQPSDVTRIGKILLSNEERGYFMKSYTDLNKEFLTPMMSKSWFKNMGEGLQRETIRSMLSDNEKMAKDKTVVKFIRLAHEAQAIHEQKIKSTQAPVLPKAFQAPGQKEYQESLEE